MPLCRRSWEARAGIDTCLLSLEDRRDFFEAHSVCARGRKALQPKSAKRTILTEQIEKATYATWVRTVPEKPVLLFSVFNVNASLHFGNDRLCA